MANQYSLVNIDTLETAVGELCAISMALGALATVTTDNEASVAGQIQTKLVALQVDLKDDSQIDAIKKDVLLVFNYPPNPSGTTAEKFAEAIRGTKDKQLEYRNLLVECITGLKTRVAELVSMDRA